MKYSCLGDSFEKPDNECKMWVTGVWLCWCFPFSWAQFEIQLCTAGIVLSHIWLFWGLCAWVAVQALGNWQQFVMAAFRLVNLGDFNPCPSLSIKSVSLFNVRFQTNGVHSTVGARKLKGQVFNVGGFTYFPPAVSLKIICFVIELFIFKSSSILACCLIVLFWLSTLMLWILSAFNSL